MKFYFSGVKSKNELEWLKEAGISRVLVDPTDFPNVINWPGNIALDSGAYRAFKSGKPLNLETYQSIATSYCLDFVVAPDAIGDSALTAEYLSIAQTWGIKNLVPVWHWGEDLKLLHQLVDRYPLVGLGGCVPWMRVDPSRSRPKADIQADKNRREENFKQLHTLCKAFGNQLHIFGLCWVKAIEQLAPLVQSADSSHWLVGARRGDVIFVHTRNGHLSQAHADILPFSKEWDRKTRCIENARAIAQFLDRAS